MRPSILPSALAVLPVLASAARADLQSPGSLLVFPLADSRAGVSCVLTITNVNPNATESLDVEVVFVTNCLEFNRTYSLSAHDTKPLLCSSQNPSGGQGYAYAFAKNPSTGRAISANHLIGSALVLDGATAREFSYSALSFASPLPPGERTDRDGDGRRDLNGIEYAAAPDELLFPSFLGQSSSYASELVLMSLTGGGDFTATVNMLVWNDNRTVFSTQHAFRCWTRVRLANISGVFNNAFLVSTDHNVLENAFSRETGWFLVDGQRAVAGSLVVADPAILALLIEPASLSSASLPFARGTQVNGSLIPVESSFPDFPGVPDNGGVFGG